MGSAAPALTAEDVVGRARGLIGTLRPLAAEAEKQRRVPAESMRLIRESGLLRVLRPKSAGGYELSMRTHLDVIAALSEGCAATAWVVGVGHAHNWMMGHMSAEAQNDVYGDGGDVLISAVIGPRGKAVQQADGSIVLNGRWPFASGCEHAAWLLLGAHLTHADGSDGGDVDLLAPASAVEILDDWSVAGLQGTGSCSVLAKDIVVPPHRKLQLDAVLERQSDAYDAADGPALYKSQATPVLSLCLCGTALGAARAALAEVLRKMPGKAVMYTPHVSHEWIPNQIAVGYAASMIHAAELVLYRAADDIDAYAARDEAMPEELRGRLRMDCAIGVRFCLDAVDRIYMNAGASALALSSPVQRAARDIRAMNMHGLLLLDASAEVYGRILLGLGSNTPIY